MCSQVGCGSPASTQSYGPGVGPIWLDNVGCTGDEGKIGDCSHNGWGIHNCVHSEDAGVNCRGMWCASRFNKM